LGGGTRVYRRTKVKTVDVRDSLPSTLFSRLQITQSTFFNRVVQRPAAHAAHFPYLQQRPVTSRLQKQGKSQKETSHSHRIKRRILIRMIKKIEKNDF
jgi:hypothetical protein